MRRRACSHRTLKPLVGTPVNAVVTLACLWILWLGAKGAYGWLVTRAVTEGGPQACKVGNGVCWPFYAAKLRFMIFGVYPYEEHWRVTLAMVLFLGAIGISMIPRFWSRNLLVLWGVTIVATAILIGGGVLRAELRADDAMERLAALVPALGCRAWPSAFLSAWCWPWRAPRSSPPSA